MMIGKANLYFTCRIIKFNACKILICQHFFLNSMFNLFLSFPDEKTKTLALESMCLIILARRNSTLKRVPGPIIPLPILTRLPWSEFYKVGKIYHAFWHILIPKKINFNILSYKVEPLPKCILISTTIIA